MTIIYYYYVSVYCYTTTMVHQKYLIMVVPEMCKHYSYFLLYMGGGLELARIAYNCICLSHHLYTISNPISRHQRILHSFPAHTLDITNDWSSTYKPFTFRQEMPLGSDRKNMGKNVSMLYTQNIYFSTSFSFNSI